MSGMASEIRLAIVSVAASIVRWSWLATLNLVPRTTPAMPRMIPTTIAQITTPIPFFTASNQAMRPAVYPAMNYAGATALATPPMPRFVLVAERGPAT